MSTTHFGFEMVDEQDKARRVRGVIDSVASKYDVMNDLIEFLTDNCCSGDQSQCPPASCTPRKGAQKVGKG